MAMTLMRPLSFQVAPMKTLWFGLGVLPNRHHFACGEWLERRQTVFDFFWFCLLSTSPEFCILLARTWQSAPPPYVAGSSLDAKALNKYLAPLYSLEHSIRTLLSASKPSIYQLSSLHFPVGARKKFLSMVPSITDYVSSNVQSAQVNSGLRQQDLPFSLA